ncbi:MAG: hypothetical protein H8E17_07815, partial [Deltaproteobacteria bacterium]|nr:hypothetical protein [Deltaproteobacteria bacterium]
MVKKFLDKQDTIQIERTGKFTGETMKNREIKIMDNNYKGWWWWQAQQ